MNVTIVAYDQLCMLYKQHAILATPYLLEDIVASHTAYSYVGMCTCTLFCTKLWPDYYMTQVFIKTV